MRSFLLLVIFAILTGWLCPINTAQAQQGNAKVLADIRSAYDALDFPVAEARIESALNEFERFLPGELTEIHVTYALILFARNDMDLATEQLRQAVQLTPTLNLDPIDTPPQLLEVFSRIKEQASVAEGPSGQPEIRYLVVQDPRAGAALRSMVVPGWGQLYKGERTKGIVLAGLWGVTAGGAVVAHIGRQNAKDQYLDSTTQAQTLERFKNYSTWHKVRNNLFLGAIGVWAYSYIDAIIKGQPVPTSLGPDTNLQFSLIPSPTTPGVAMQFSF